MGRILVILMILLGLAGTGAYIYINRPEPPLESKFIQNIRQKVQLPEGDSQVILIEPGESALVPNSYHVFQTFNNCGPATLSMALNWWGVEASQAEVADIIRPYRNQAGDNDDKNTFSNEFVETAQKYGLKAVTRVNGDIELLKRFTANGIPVVVKTQLKTGDDIGHFRLVTGYNESEKVIIQDDSYQGRNKKYSYYDFLSLWQLFNYDYIVVYTPETEAKVKAILGEEWDEQVAWKNALERAEEEHSLDPDNLFPTFNISVASYRLGDYQKSVAAFEEVEARLSRRQLWYQIEPILAYQKLGQYDRVFEIIEKVFATQNRGFAELYLIRGEIYLEQGDRDKARAEFEQALFYNKNLKAAQMALDSL
jgi:tetratricopeptide (TPR) repeat protein